MSLVNQNGQKVSSETPAAAPVAAPRSGATPADMQKIIGAYAQLKQLNAQTILSPNDEAIKQGLINFLTGALFAHAEELFGAWVAVNQEYSPLIQGFTAILSRALNRIDASNRVPSASVTETPDAAAPAAA